MKRFYLLLTPLLILCLLLLSSAPALALSPAEQNIAPNLWTTDSPGDRESKLLAQSSDSGCDKPDLVVESLSWTPTSLSCGQDLYNMKFAVRVKNVGGADAANFMLKLSTSGSNMDINWGLGINGLASGATEEVVFPPSFVSGYFALRGGHYDVRALADSEKEVDECLEDNNAKMGQFDVPAQVRLISAADGETNIGTITLAGKTYGLPARLCAQLGSYPVEAKPASGYSFQRWETGGALTVAEANSASTTVTISGDGTLKAVFKPSGERAQLEVTPGSIEKKLAPGESASEEITISNAGTIDLQGVRLSAGGEIEGWISFSQSNISSIKPGGNKTVTVTITVPEDAAQEEQAPQDFFSPFSFKLKSQQFPGFPLPFTHKPGTEQFPFSSPFKYKPKTQQFPSWLFERYPSYEKPWWLPYSEAPQADRDYSGQIVVSSTNGGGKIIELRITVRPKQNP